MRTNTGGEKNNHFSCKYYNCPGLLRLSERTVLERPNYLSYQLDVQSDTCEDTEIIQNCRCIV